MSLNDYKILHQVGKGQFGVVYKGYQKIDSMPIALKVCNIKMDRIQKEIAMNEIKILKTIHCPQIIQLYESFQKEDALYMVLEYCSQGDLEKLFRNKKGPKEKLIKLIAIQLIKALVYLQEMNIAHRDIKLQNIFVNEKYEIKLADLGFAKVIGQQLLKTNVGTPLNMAPQILNNQRYTNKCDIWSFGIVIYQLFYGKFPFYPQNNTRKTLCQMVNTNPVQFPEHLHVSLEVQDLISKCLQKNPNTRISAKQLLQHPWIISQPAVNGQLQKTLKQTILQSSGFIFNQQDQQNDTSIQDDLVECEKIVSKQIWNFNKNFQNSIRYLTSIYNSCYKILKQNKQQIGIQCLLTSVQTKCKQIQGMSIILSFGEHEIKLISQQYTKAKSAISYFRKLPFNNNTISDHETKLFNIIRSNFDVYYRLVTSIKELFKMDFSTYYLKFQYEQTYVRRIQSQFNQILTERLTKAKILQFLNKPNDKIPPQLIDIFTTKLIHQNKKSSIIYYLECLQPLAELKQILKSKEI